MEMAINFKYHSGFCPLHLLLSSMSQTRQMLLNWGPHLLTELGELSWDGEWAASVVC